MLHGKLTFDSEVLPLYVPENVEETRLGYDAVPRGEKAGMLFCMVESGKSALLPVVKSRDALDLLWMENGRVSAACSLLGGIVGGAGDSFLELPLGYASRLKLGVGSEIKWQLNEKRKQAVEL